MTYLPATVRPGGKSKRLTLPGRYMCECDHPRSGQGGSTFIGLARGRVLRCAAGWAKCDAGDMGWSYSAPPHSDPAARLRSLSLPALRRGRGAAEGATATA